MAKIYLSSTFEDLKAERHKAGLALRRLGHQVIGMEDYVAADSRPLDKCLNDVAECDAYVGIFAFRYGYVPEKDNQECKSITELEYREATRRNKPRFIFLLPQDVPWPPMFVDDGKSRRSVTELRSKLIKDHSVSFFKNPDELGALVGPAITNWVNELPASKARGDHAVTPSPSINSKALVPELAPVLPVSPGQTEICQTIPKKEGASHTLRNWRRLLRAPVLIAFAVLILAVWMPWSCLPWPPQNPPVDVQIVKIASGIATPLALAGLFAAILFFVVRYLILKQGLFPKLTKAAGEATILLVINRLFVLSLVAMILGFVAYVLPQFQSPDTNPPISRDYELSGTVWDEHSEPLAGVEVRLTDAPNTPHTLTGPTGHFSFSITSTNERQVRLVAQKKGYHTYSADPTIGNPKFEFKMDPSP